MSRIAMGLGLLAAIIVVVFVIFNVYGVSFSHKSFLKFRRFWSQAEHMYRQIIAEGLSPRYALRRVSLWRHPELGESVHEAMCSKFHDLGALVNFLFWGLEQHDQRSCPLTDDVALAIIEKTTVVQKGLYDYRVEVK